MHLPVGNRAYLGYLVVHKKSAEEILDKKFKSKPKFCTKRSSKKKRSFERTEKKKEKNPL